MQRVAATTIGVLTLFTLPAEAAFPPASSSFDVDLEGWMVMEGANFTNEVTWGATGGNPGGYAHFVDAHDQTSYHAAQAAFAGDWSAADGIGAISYDQKIFDVGPTPVMNAYEVFIGGTGGLVMWHGDTPTGTTDWVNVVAPLVESEWSVVSGSWAGALADISGLAIRAELVSFSRDVTGLDNVSVYVPEPATAALLAVGTLAIFRRRQP